MLLCLLLLYLCYVPTPVERNSFLTLLTVFMIHHHGTIQQLRETCITANGDPVGLLVKVSVSLPIFAVANEQ